jgi:hypothetical protein
MNRLLKYFDIQGEAPDSDRLPLGKANSVWTQWSALFLGVLIQPYFEGFRQTRTWHFSGFWGWTLFALITSVIIFPAVYRKAFDAEAPAIIQIAPIFAAGLGWESLIGTILKVDK